MIKSVGFDRLLGVTAAWAAYRAYGLAEFYAPSLYHPYYLCLGTHCNCAFDPPAQDFTASGGIGSAGVGAAVDALRNISGLPPSPSPPGPAPRPVPENCSALHGFDCHQGQYCSDVLTGQMTDYAHVGSETLSACEAICIADSHCSCFIHTDRPDPPLYMVRLPRRRLSPIS